MKRSMTCVPAHVARGAAAAMRVVLLLVAGSWVAAAAPRTAEAQFGFAADTMGIRVELGVTTDLTNEIFYESAFVDTTFLGRRTLSSPESRIAGVLFTALHGTRAGRSTRYTLQNELRIGDKLQRNVTQLRWYNDFAPDWRFTFAPQFEFKRDQTFDRDLQEVRGRAGAQVRRSFHDGLTYADFRLTGEFLRTAGDGADFLPDRNEVRTAVAVDRLAVFGHEWRLGYRLAARQFPDSTVRDHLEHGWEGRWKYNLNRGHFILFETDGVRRQTVRIAPTSRDNFWEEWVRSELVLRANDSWAWRTRAELEALQYDVQDTTIYFNYYVARAATGPRWDRGLPWTFSAGPLIERLGSHLNPAESYTEFGGFFEIEYLGRAGWWSLQPSAARRSYGTNSGGTDELALHSSYNYYDLTLFGDQAVPGGLRVRVLGTVRLEQHAVEVDDATSLYFSLDVRRIF
jgi:hypothetical protein